MAAIRRTVPSLLLILSVGVVRGLPEPSKEMEKYKVVPDIIPVVPPATVIVKYGELTVDMGNELTPTQVHNKPSITWGAKEGAYYTLLMTDPDVSPISGSKQVQHWLVVNIPGNDVSKGETLFEYIGSGPPEGTGIHRYIFILYKQKKKLDDAAYSSLRDGKLGTIANRFANTLMSLKTQLELEDVEAVNFYRAKFDDNVPAYREEFMKKYSA